MKHFETQTEQQTLDHALTELARATGLPIAFGGFAHGSEMEISVLKGTRTRSLHGLVVKPGRGLGGKAIAEARPRLTADYEHSLQITHDYDRQVLGEGIVSLFAFPIVLAGRTRALLYGASRDQSHRGSLLSLPVAAIAQPLVNEIRVRDEVERRIGSVNAASAEAQQRVSHAVSREQDPRRALSTAKLEELRESYAELRSIAAEVSDPALRSRLGSLEDRLARITGAVDAEATTGPAGPQVRLSPRETDVLSYAALGYTNAGIGAALGLTEGTVKAYLKTATAKLDCSNRHAAVSAARRAGLIP